MRANHRATLGEIAEFINGVAFKPEDWGEDGKRIIRIQNLTDPTKPYNRTTRTVDEKYYVHRGDLLVSWSASLGVFVWNHRDVAVVNQHIFKVVPNPERVDGGYLRQMLIDALERMEGHLHGATMKHVNRAEFLNTTIPLPPLEEQKRIAGILDAADALRAKRREALAELDKLLQSTFIHMFGDPVTNPMGWKMGVIGDLLASADYGSSKKANSEGGDFPILRMGNIKFSGEWDFSDLKYIDLSAKEQSKYLVHKGQILFNRTNSKELVGKTAVYRLEKPMAFAGYLIRGVVKENADPEYVGAFMNTPQVKQLLRNKCKNIVGMANINAREFQSIELSIPPYLRQRRFAEIVEAVERQKSRMRSHLAELDALFASLQSRAFNGEL